MDHLLNTDFAESHLFSSDSYARFHGVLPSKKYLGTSILYFSFAYMLPAKMAVVLGSGEGFVPRLLRQAQKEAGDEAFQKESRCILIDANLHIKTFGKAFYHDNPNHFHHQLYPEVEIWKIKTDDGPERLKKEGIKIDYLHIDANHCFDQSLKDFSNYLPLMSENFIISLHDTGTFFSGHLDGCVPRTIAHLKKEMEPGGLYPGLEIIDFNNRFHKTHPGFNEKSFCNGTAFIKPRTFMPWDSVYQLF